MPQTCEMDSSEFAAYTLQYSFNLSTDLLMGLSKIRAFPHTQTGGLAASVDRHNEANTWNAKLVCT